MVKHVLLKKDFYKNTILNIRNPMLLGHSYRDRR